MVLTCLLVPINASGIYVLNRLVDMKSNDGSEDRVVESLAAKDDHEPQLRRVLCCCCVKIRVIMGNRKMRSIMYRVITACILQIIVSVMLLLGIVDIDVNSTSWTYPSPMETIHPMVFLISDNKFMLIFLRKYAHKVTP